MTDVQTFGLLSDKKWVGITESINTDVLEACLDFIFVLYNSHMRAEESS